MMNLISKLIEAIYWVMLFLCPVIIMGIIAFIVYQNYKNLVLPIIIGAGGIILGILLAERVRKKYGTSNFYGRLIRTPELENQDSGNNSPI